MNTYSTSYELINSEGIKQANINEPCFYKIFNEEKQKKINIFIPQRASAIAYCPLNINYIRYWCDLLNKTGIDVFCDEKNHIKYFNKLKNDSVEEHGEHCYCIKYTPHENNYMLFPVIITLIRFLYESPKTELVKCGYDNNLSLFQIITYCYKEWNKNDGGDQSLQNTFYLSGQYDWKLIDNEKEFLNLIKNYNIFRTKRKLNGIFKCTYVHSAFINKTYNKIYIIDKDKSYNIEWLSKYMKIETEDNPDNANVFLFTQNAEKNKEYYIKAIKESKKMIGINEGSYFLCLMNGGKLAQNIKNHTHPHLARLNHEKYFMLPDSRKSVSVSSSHLQMQYPFNLPEENYEIWAYSANMSSVYEGDLIERDKISIDPEIIYYPKTKSLAIQCNPEIINSMEGQNKIAILINLFLYE